MQEASPSSTSSKPIVNCSICNQHIAKYTCPRCSTHTCCLQCSNAHKTKTSCSGARNKIAYVPMKDFGYGALMNDYVYLEEVGRQISEWGREIVRGGYMGELRGGRGRRRGHARGMRHSQAGGGGGGRTKRDILKIQLDIRDIDMRLLPMGMERRKLNQSIWDFKNKTALLTIQFTFHPPPNPLRPPHIPADRPTVFTTHRNNIDTPLISIIQKQIPEKSKSRRERRFPEWLISLVFPDDPDTLEPLACYILAPSDPAHKSPAYHKLDPSQKLSTLLRHKEFVEFPVIEVWEGGSFVGTVVDDHGSIVQYGKDEDDIRERERKRRKLNTKQGKAAIKGLLGDYGSDEQEETEDTSNVLSKLDGYVDSDAEQEHQEDMHEISIEGWDDEDEEEPLVTDPASLLEELKKVDTLPNQVLDSGDETFNWENSDQE